VLKEREKKQMAGIDGRKLELPKGKIEPSPSNSQSPRSLHLGGTYESFFEIDNRPPPDDTCSLKDLFSQRGNSTKKRPLEDK